MIIMWQWSRAMSTG